MCKMDGQCIFLWVSGLLLGPNPPQLNGKKFNQEPLHGSTCRKRKGAVTEQLRNCSWFLVRQGKGFHSRAMQGSDFKERDV